VGASHRPSVCRFGIHPEELGRLQRRLAEAITDGLLAVQLAMPEFTNPANYAIENHFTSDRDPRFR
jgi:hypothetical protein